MVDQNSNEPRFAIISEDFIDNLICTSFFDRLVRYILKQLDLSASWTTSLNSHGLIGYYNSLPAGFLRERESSESRLAD